MTLAIKVVPFGFSGHNQYAQGWLCAGITVGGGQGTMCDVGNSNQDLLQARQMP